MLVNMEARQVMSNRLMDSTVHAKAPAIHLVAGNDSREFCHLRHALTHSSVIGLDAEWKPNRSASTFPNVSLLQIACRIVDSEELPVFLLDLQMMDLEEVYGLLSEMLVSVAVIKLGFRFKQDLMYLSSTFCERGCGRGFDRVEPYIDVSAIYNSLQPKVSGRKLPKHNKSLATICKEVLGISLSKELQCSDWSQRPLTGEQKAYAAADAHCLVEIFNVFLAQVVREGIPSQRQKKHSPSDSISGLKEILELPDRCNIVLTNKLCDAANMARVAIPEVENGVEIVDRIESSNPSSIAPQIDSYLVWVIRKHGDKLVLKDMDRRPKGARRKVKSSSGVSVPREKDIESLDDVRGPSPWDPALGGDGQPKFLCDVMIEGLAKHLRCVGIDAAVPISKKPGARDLITQAQKEGRVILTRDVKLLRHGYLIKNQIYRIKNLIKNDQLLEVIEAFQLKISEDQLMSRCTKCNGCFIQKPLTTEEAVEAAKGFQEVPKCLFNKNLEFWQCRDCRQLYWEGTQYHNAVQKFIDVCKLNE